MSEIEIPIIDPQENQSTSHLKGESSHSSPYISHLLELRQRIFLILSVYVCLSCPLIYFSRELYTFMAQPLLHTLPHGSHLIATTVIAPFMVPLKLALFISFILTIPFILYQIWGFVAPGLYRHEKQTISPLLSFSILLFYGGMAFAHCIVCPMALGFFAHMAPEGVAVMTDMSHYLDFIFGLYFAFGLAFQVPLITFLLIQLGITSVETLQKHRPYIIVAAFIIGMLLTPPDVISQILLAVPLLLLFEMGLWLAKRKT